MAVLSYPGVYVNEVPSGVRTITGVATSITAFVGRALRGPVDKAVTITSFADFERTFGGLWIDSRLGYAVRDFYVQGGGVAVIVRVYKHQATTTDTATIAFGTATTPAKAFELKAASPGAWGLKLNAVIDLDVSAAPLFNLTVTDTGSGAVEIFRNVSFLTGHPRRVDIVVANESRLVVVDTLPVTATGTTPAPTAFAVTAATGGHDGDPATQTEILGVPAAKTGLYALEDVDLVNLIVVPPYTPSDDVPSGVITVAATYATARRAILITELGPAATSVATAKTAAGATTSRNAAVYFQRIRQPDPLRDGQIGTFPAVGAIAGVIARTDATRGVWKAPAGLDARIAGVSELSVPLTDLEIGQLNPLGINCLRFAPGAGHVVWGARTCDGADRNASEWKYLPVRRTALFLEESLYRGMQWVVFEPNDAPLWAQIRLNAGAFMNGLFRQGAFAGTSPKEAYFVKCDAETTTQDDINAGIVNILVGFAPLKPAEFVVISLQQMASQSGGA
jgi:phage tail sheath protein FI